jgi:hypothetical protein
MFEIPAFVFVHPVHWSPNQCLRIYSFFPPEGGVRLVPKRGCLLTLAYYSFPIWYEFVERRWNDIDRGKSKNSEKNLSQCHFVYHKSHMDWPGRQPGPPRWEAGDQRSEPWHGRTGLLQTCIIAKQIKICRFIAHWDMKPIPTDKSSSSGFCVS